ncbi:hypothetical protein E143388_00031 [Rhodococcus opacus]|nr:hypothetical protein E143388_00031 [Rhodococcus opacus]
MRTVGVRFRLGRHEVESAAAEDPRAPSGYGPEEDLEVSQ